MSRKVAREELFKLIFECELTNEDPKIILESYLKRDGVSLTKNDMVFLNRFMNGISEHKEEILSIINTNMTGWTFERLGNIEKALLICAVYELKFEDTPHEVVLNEVIEIAKIYGEEKSSDFINGVLAKIIA